MNNEKDGQSFLWNLKSKIQEHFMNKSLKTHYFKDFSRTTYNSRTIQGIQEPMATLRYQVSFWRNNFEFLDQIYSKTLVWSSIVKWGYDDNLKPVYFYLRKDFVRTKTLTSNMHSNDQSLHFGIVRVTFMTLGY